ncbi:hypothetical protein Vretimale_10526 [Volvox reticuliferus]|uniref:Uncharacterized protein n=1 Tax=Volvox reticuliferus TaxID=1737510 RepID=A0A8J4GFL3_9CHLO|nr:hypothetical protein Vretimale_10526 [Volvox reticuliferus]
MLELPLRSIMTRRSAAARQAATQRESVHAQAALQPAAPLPSAVSQPAVGQLMGEPCQDPALNKDTDDQEASTDRKGPKAAAAPLRTEWGCGARGTSGAGKWRRSLGADMSPGLVRGKKPRPAVAHSPWLPFSHLQGACTR